MAKTSKKGICVTAIERWKIDAKWSTMIIEKRAPEAAIKMVKTHEKDAIKMKQTLEMEKQNFYNNDRRTSDFGKFSSSWKIALGVQKFV